MSSDLSILLSDPSNERLNVEYKSWIDLRDPSARAKIARHLAAISNSDGGYLIFGVDDKTRRPLGPPTSFDVRQVVTQDVISDIVRKYLAPPFQCDLHFVEHNGTDYPIVIIFGHGSSPVTAIAGGPPDEKGRPTGITQGNIYYRDVGPRSSAISRPEQWTELLERCLSRRADILASIMRRAINISPVPSADAKEHLRAACEATSEDFAEQAQQDIGLSEPDAGALRTAANNHVTIGYSIIGNDGKPIAIENPTIVNARVNVALHRYADYGWTYFYPVRVPERAPQYQNGFIGGHECTYVEGMRIATSADYHGGVEYWRAYEAGFWCLSHSFREDYHTLVHNCDPGLLEILQCLMKFHGMLAHARLLGEELAEPHLVMLRMHWQGLSGRQLAYRQCRGGVSEMASLKAYTANTFTKTLIFKWSEIRDDYFSALKRVCVAFFIIFEEPDFNPEEMVTREWIEQEFRRLGVRSMRLF
jgi:hypothetical protein